MSTYLQIPMMLALTWAVGATSPADLEAAAGSTKSTVKSGPTHLEQAAEHYNRGLRHRDKGWKYEEQAAAADADKARAKYLEKAHKEFAKAIDQQLSATRKSPTFHEAHASLGYALRKVGKYDRALKAYDRSLELRPDYVEAVQYRAVAHLALGRIVETKSAYDKLFVRDPELAAGLLREMDQWLERGEGLSAGKRDSLLSWMESKRTTAREMGDSGDKSQGDW
jgi:tetratricopeptide (TPR) repeat protein